ncbi:hypothetical protein IV79_GL001502 [Pediococcus claussenii]|nr:hypothetical protein IV79_GL001502 [Pediococcus claussenii]
MSNVEVLILKQKRDLSSEKIIQATIKIIEKRGAEAATFRNIADVLECKTQALYFYFKNNRDLLIGVAQTYFKEMNAEIGRSCVGLIGDEAIIELALTIKDFSLKHKNVGVAVFRIPKITEDPETELIFKEISNTLKKYIGDFVKDEREILVIARGVRDLILGEVINESVGWFKNPMITQDDSFTWNLRQIMNVN